MTMTTASLERYWKTWNTYEALKPPSRSSFLTYDLVFCFIEKQGKKSEENVHKLPPPPLPTFLQLHLRTVPIGDFSASNKG